MPSQSNPIILQVSSQPSRTTIGIGLSWDQRVFMQEYWSQGKPYYTIANVSSQSVEITIAEWHGGVGKRLLGPWTVVSNTIQCHDILDLVTSYADPLVAVSINTNPMWGLLQTPRPPTFPPNWDELEGILTVVGFNGVGDRNTNLCCLQPQINFDSGQTISLTLWIPENTGTLSFGGTESPSSLPQGIVIGAKSSSLSVEEHGGVLIVGAQETPGVTFHDVQLSVQLPEVISETLVVLLGRVASRSGASFSFGRGLIVHD